MAGTDPSKPVSVFAKFKSPQVVSFYFWYKRPADSLWTKFASAEDPSHASLSSHEYEIGPLEPGTKLMFQLHFTGNAGAPYLASINVRQNESDLIELVAISGKCDENGVGVPDVVNLELP